MKITVSPHSSMCVLSRFSRGQLWATLWTVAFQAPLSMGLSRQEHWSGLPHPPPGDLPDLGTEPASFTSPALAGGLFTPGTPGTPGMGAHFKIQKKKILPSRQVWCYYLGNYFQRAF